jgi:hypothetical protein
MIKQGMHCEIADMLDGKQQAQPLLVITKSWDLSMLESSA